MSNSFARSALTSLLLGTVFVLVTALATLDRITFDELSAEEKVNAQVFRTSIRALANDVRFRTYEAPFNSDTFFWTDFTPRQGFATAGAYRAFLGQVVRKFDQRPFHDAILAIGSVPLPVLEQRMSQVIADGDVNPFTMNRP